MKTEISKACVFINDIYGITKGKQLLKWNNIDGWVLVANKADSLFETLKRDRT